MVAFWALLVVLLASPLRDSPGVWPNPGDLLTPARRNPAMLENLLYGPDGWFTVCPPPEWWHRALTENKAPFPWFGGKSKAVDLVWDRFGEVKNYVEPFIGSAAVLLGRPRAPTIETANDYDGFVSNLWRAIQADPDKVADYADWPVNEADLHARHKWLVKRKAMLRARLLEDPTFYDARIAGWWVWGTSIAIGDNFNRAQTNALPKLSDHGNGIHGQNTRSRLHEVFRAIAQRLRYTRITCGDFERILSPAVTWRHGTTGVFLDPPYPSDAGSTGGIYSTDAHERETFARAFRYCLENGTNKDLRIALCYYEGTTARPAPIDGMPVEGPAEDVSHALRSLGWEIVPWKAGGGYGGQNGKGNENASRERIAFSPHCLRAKQRSLF